MLECAFDERARFAKAGDVVVGDRVGALHLSVGLVLHQCLRVCERDIDVVRIGSDGFLEKRHCLGILCRRGS